MICPLTLPKLSPDFTIRGVRPPLSRADNKKPAQWRARVTCLVLLGWRFAVLADAGVFVNSLGTCRAFLYRFTPNPYPDEGERQANYH